MLTNVLRQSSRIAGVLCRTTVSLQKLKTLRDMTGSPVLQCKEALDAAKDNVEQAKAILEARGLAQVKPKARRYKDGYIAMQDTEKGVSLVQLNCETDFVARTKEFLETLRMFTHSLEAFPKSEVANADIVAFLKAALAGKVPAKYEKKSAKDVVALLCARTMENCSISGLFKRAVEPGVIIGTYLHGAVEGQTDPKVGTKAGIVVVESESKNLAGVKKLADSLALHVAAMRPMYKDKESLPKEMAESKGKDKAFLEEMVMMEQQYFESDEAKTVREAIIQKQYELHAKVNIKEFLYFDCKQ